MSDLRQTLTFAEYVAAEQEAYDALMARRDAARKAEAEYWRDDAEPDEMPAVLRVVKKQYVREITSVSELLSECEED